MVDHDNFAERAPTVGDIVTFSISDVCIYDKPASEITDCLEILSAKTIMKSTVDVFVVCECFNDDICVICQAGKKFWARRSFARVLNRESCDV